MFARAKRSGRGEYSAMRIEALQWVRICWKSGSRFNSVFPIANPRRCKEVTDSGIDYNSPGVYTYV
jgi:hypothetical protein